ncbi:MAG TPA: hypothetical protein DCX37_04325 [Firmicutes bacterium]|nr:hypothetical protein [Bacillota bacterium]HCF90650.1 hypothetical protein [Bacillota bacterium]
MKPLWRSFGVFIRQIIRDNMLWAVCFAPLLAALFFRYGIPLIEGLLCGYFQQQAILSDYYLLFDLLLSLLTPYLFCYVSAMVMLTERDENMAGYMAVTPVGKSGYVMSRLVFPALIALVASVLLMSFFTLTVWLFWTALAVCLLTCLLSITVALLIFSLSRNRVEGMAMAKMAGLLILGLLVPFFILSNVKYLAAPLPSFWIAEFCITQNVLLLLPAALISLIWIWLLYGRFVRKLY